MRRLIGWVATATLLAGMAGPGWAQQAAPPGPGAQPAGPTVFGRVKATSADSLTLLVGRARQEETFAIDASTSIQKASQIIPVTELAPDDLVRLTYRSVDGKKIATVVSVRPPRGAGGRQQSPSQPKTP